MENTFKPQISKNMVTILVTLMLSEDLLTPFIQYFQRFGEVSSNLVTPINKTTETLDF